MKTIIANFKSNKNTSQMQEWISQFTSEIKIISSSSHFVFCPSFPHLPLFSALSSQDNMSLGAQDISPFPAGAYTGAVGTQNLSELPIQYVIVGHSERRKYFHETSQEIAQKIRECMSVNITPIVCVTKEEIDAQANALTSEERSKVWVAFEPIEYIGTGVSDSLENVVRTKELVETAFGAVPYIYGGSVNPKTSKELLTSSAIDGFLVGTASLDAHTFVELSREIG